MSERLKAIKEKSKLRRQLLAPILESLRIFKKQTGEIFSLPSPCPDEHERRPEPSGASDADTIGHVLGNKPDAVLKPETKQKNETKVSEKKTKDESSSSKKKSVEAFELPGIQTDTPPKVVTSEEKAPAKKKPKKEYTDEDDYSEGEFEEMQEAFYKDSSTFLKGTQSANPHNDYCQHFVDTGQRPQNFIRDVGLADRFEEYPKLKELIRLKDEIIAKRATPPMYLQCDFETFDLRELECKFDAILVDPPLEEYQRRGSGISHNWRPWTWDEIMKLEIEEIAAQRSFIFLWCGSHEGLGEGRKCLRKWGFRRCEDICWIKTNKKNPGNVKFLEPNAIFQHTKEHCLMGIKGTVRRSTDFDFIHANVDIDLIITEEPPIESTEKPEEIFHIIEHFCLGRRRLHLFGNDSTLRPGWLTVGPDLSSSNFSSETYNSYFNSSPTEYLVGDTPEIENLRPKSPKAKNKGDGGKGRGGSGGPAWASRGMRGIGGRGIGGRGGLTRGIGFSIRGNRGLSRGGFPTR